MPQTNQTQSVFDQLLDNIELTDVLDLHQLSAKEIYHLLMMYPEAPLV